MIFDKRWDDANSDPIADVYRTAILMSNGYEAKEKWTIKLLRRLREIRKNSTSE